MKDKIDEIMGLVDDVVENAELLAKSSKHYAAFCASKKTIESKLRELEKDAARLDYMIDNQACVEYGCGVFWLECADGTGQSTHRKSAREAIDAAMQKD